jgi:hypothetical protein
MMVCVGRPAPIDVCFFPLCTWMREFLLLYGAVVVVVAFLGWLGVGD